MKIYKEDKKKMTKEEYKNLKNVIDICLRNSSFTKEELNIISLGNETLNKMKEKSEKQIEKAKHTMKEKRKMNRTYGRGKLIEKGYYKDNNNYFAKKFREKNS